MRNIVDESDKGLMRGSELKNRDLLRQEEELRERI